MEALESHSTSRLLRDSTSLLVQYWDGNRHLNDTSGPVYGGEERLGTQQVDTVPP